MAPGNKERLYVVIFANTPPDKFHWGICTGPKLEEKQKEPPGVLFHVKNPLGADGKEVWIFERKGITSGQMTRASIARFLIGKIVKSDALDRILQNVHVRQGDPNRRCRHWVRDAISALANSTGVVGTSVDLSNWPLIETEATQYGKDKTLAGRFKDSDLQMKFIPTYDMMARKELVE